MMKKMIVRLCVLLGSLLSIFQSDKIKAINERIYTGKYMFKFKRFGKDSVITPKFRYVCGMKYISIGNCSSIGTLVTLTAVDRYQNQIFFPKITIGDNSIIGDFSHVTCINEIRIGNNVRMGRNILITDNSHGLSVKSEIEIAPNKRPLYSKGAVIIEDNVWIGEKSSILPGVSIGYGSIIASNSVVTKDVPPFTVVGGNPAKFIKKIL